jgi:hypothetical protein
MDFYSLRFIPQMFRILLRSFYTRFFGDFFNLIEDPSPTTTFETTDRSPQRQYSLFRFCHSSCFCLNPFPVLAPTSVSHPLKCKSVCLYVPTLSLAVQCPVSVFAPVLAFCHVIVPCPCLIMPIPCQANVRFPRSSSCTCSVLSSLCTYPCPLIISLLLS